MRTINVFSVVFAGTSSRYITKRLLDVVICTVALLLLCPLFLLFMLLIRLDSPGPALFRQQRVGKGGKLFSCLKFRTMQQNADQRVHQLAVQQFVTGQALSDNPNARFKMLNDRRVTRVGAFLRRTSLDELPQLINVLRGEMSLVGPRPAIPYELEHFQIWHHQRHDVKPGITGLWQVYGRSRVGFNEMMALDVRYAASWSIWLDIKLILLTIPAILMQRGAR